MQFHSVVILQRLALMLTYCVFQNNNSASEVTT